MPARIISFHTGFIHAAAHLLGELCGVVFGIAFEHTLKDDTLGTVGDMFGGRQYLYAVVFERLLVNRRFIFIAGETIELVNCDIFLWTLF